MSAAMSSQATSGVFHSGPFSTWPARLLTLGLVVGAAGDYLLWSGLFRSERLNGAGLLAWIFVLGIAGQLLNLDAGNKWRNTVLLWSGVALTAAIMMTLRDSPALVPLMLLVLLGALGTLTLQSVRGSVLEVRLGELKIIIGQVLVNIFFGTVKAMLGMDLRGSLANYRWQGYVRGVVIALPLLLVFSILFANADAKFDGYMSSFTDIFSLSTPQHILVILILGWFSAGLLLCTRRQVTVYEASRKKRRHLGAEETAVVMGSLAVLFVSFVVLQLGYLFGGQETSQEVSGLTLSEYARRGFFELLAVAALTLTVLMLMSGTDCAVRIFRPLANVLIVCVLIILLSAVQRLLLYVDEYGFTLQRMTALAVMIWLGFNLLSFTFTLLRGRTATVAATLVFSGIVTMLVFALVNPVNIVTKVNLDRAIDNAMSLDVDYLASLGADAVPATFDRFEELAPSTQCSVARHLLDQWGLQNPEMVSQDWRHWNRSRSKARKLVNERSAALQAMKSHPGCSI